MPHPDDLKYQVDKYLLRVFGGAEGPFGSRAVVELYGRAAKNGPGPHDPPVVAEEAERMVGCLWFFDAGRPVPPNSLTAHEGIQIRYPTSIIQSALGVLRTGERVWVAYSLTGEDAYMFTWDEAIGEGTTVSEDRRPGQQYAF